MSSSYAKAPRKAQVDRRERKEVVRSGNLVGLTGTPAPIAGDHERKEEIKVAKTKTSRVMLTPNVIPPDIPMEVEYDFVPTDLALVFNNDPHQFVKAEPDIIQFFGKNHLEPRLTGFYQKGADSNVEFKYSKKSMKARDWNSAVEALAVLVCAKANADTRFVYTDPKTGEVRPIRVEDCKMLFNLYRTGKDKVAYHSDKDALPVSADRSPWGFPRPSRPVYSISFHETRSFLVRRLGATKAICSMEMRDRMLCVMRAGMQERFEHSVSATAKKNVSWRLNATIRFD